MKILSFKNIILSLSFFLLISFSSYAGKKTYGDIEVTEVVRVYDGDTITVNIPDFPKIIGEEIGIRISGIDTPEIRDKNKDIKEFAIYVRDLVREHLKKSKQIFLCNMKRGKYFRIVADVIVDDENLGDILVKSGFAKYYDGGKKDPWTIGDLEKFRNSKDELIVCESFDIEKNDTCTSDDLEKLSDFEKEVNKK